MDKERYDIQVLRLQVAIRGAVQGVGFRPFIYRLATDLGLRGWVNNSSQGVFIEVEGGREPLETFLLRIEGSKPPRAFIQSLEYSYLDAVGYTTFEIRESDPGGEKTALILPDIATCPDCLGEIFDPEDRRFLYPFTNCTNCGPRFSIIEALPYDRPNTTMMCFAMCERCRAEYENPLDRRFHAQPNACPDCGPHLELWDGEGNVLLSYHDALLEAADAVRHGAVIAVKGLGGFHFMVDGRSEEGVLRLRRLKGREEKPLALMYPSLESLHEHCEISALEERLLSSPESPIVLLRKDTGSKKLSPSVAPDNPYIGVMIPYTPLHHLLISELGFPVVATSGNLSDEPICTDEVEALVRLKGIADLFLVHDRPIARHVDDSLVRLMMGRELVLRRARGYAPLPIHLKEPLAPTLALGAHLKNSIAASVEANVFLSQHIGDLETTEAFDAFRRVIADFALLYDLHPTGVACDAHPDYLSTRYAHDYGLAVIPVQHHYAHVLSCMAENELDGPVLGVSWDGSGYGLDGTIWGGEFLRVTEGSFERTAYFRTFPLPGGDAAIKEPKRTALGLLYELYDDALFEENATDVPSTIEPLRAFSPQELQIIQTMLKRGINAPLTSSVGRLFDAVAAIVGLRQERSFEGQAAMELEYALEGIRTDEAYEFHLTSPGDGATFVVDWGALVEGILNDLASGTAVGEIAAKFHNTLVETIIVVARRMGEEGVVLSGGCFQNKYLTERAVHRLMDEGFRPYWHQRIPPNDGGIALGQVVAAAHHIAD